MLFQSKVCINVRSGIKSYYSSLFENWYGCYETSILVEFDLSGEWKLFILCEKTRVCSVEVAHGISDCPPSFFPRSGPVTWRSPRFLYMFLDPCYSPLSSRWSIGVIACYWIFTTLTQFNSKCTSWFFTLFVKLLFKLYLSNSYSVDEIKNVWSTCLCW